MEVLEWRPLNFAENVFSDFLVNRIPFAPSMAVKKTTYLKGMVETMKEAACHLFWKV